MMQRSGDACERLALRRGRLGDGAVRLTAGLGVLMLAGMGPAVAQTEAPVAQIPSQVEGREPVQPLQPPPSMEQPIALPTVTAPALGAPPGSEAALVTLGGIQIDGMTVYPAGTFAPLYQNLIGQQVPLSRIFEIAQAVEDRYRADGYVLSRVVVPAQTVADGVFRLQVLEGYISTVVTQGDIGNVRPLIESTLANLTQARPIRIQDIERYLLLVNDIPGIDAKGVLRPATGEPGAAQLIVDVDRDPLEGFARLDNRGSEFTGPLELAGRVSANSFTRFGEQTSLTLYSALDKEESRYGRLDVTGRFGDEGLSAGAFASYSPSEPGSSLAPLDVESEALRFGFDVRYPVIRSRKANLYVDGGFDYADIDIDLLGTPDTRDHLRVLHAGVQGSYRDSWNGLSQLSFTLRQGLPLFGATESDDDNRSRTDADGTFTSLSFEASRLQQLWSGINLYVAAKGQYAFQPVLADEEFTIGGASFGRGYEPAELGGDHGLAGTVELQYNPDFGRDLLENYQVYAFYDIGVVWQKDQPGSDKESLASAGVGLRANVNDWLYFDVEAAKPLTREPSNGDDKDVRFYFSLAAQF